MKKIVAVTFLFIQSVIFSQNSSKILVYVFLSETCPICQSYTVKLKELDKKYSEKVSFVGVFPNYYSTAETINTFKTTYNLSFKLVKDENSKLTNDLKALITPEAFVIDENGKLIYRGRIDNSFYEVGKKRNVITTNELEEAIEAALFKKEIKENRTKAVGCLISTSK